MSLSKRVNKLLTRLEEEGKINGEYANRVKKKARKRYERIDEEIKRFEQVLNLVDSTGIPPEDISYLLRKGFPKELIMQLGEIADEYDITRSVIRFDVYKFMKGGVPIEDVPGLMEIREILHRPGLRHDLIISAYQRLGGVEALRQYAEFILENRYLIASAFPGKLSRAEMQKIPWFGGWIIYDMLCGRDPKKAKEALESYVNSL